MKKYIKLYEEFNGPKVPRILTDPVEITTWIDTWKDEPLFVGRSIYRCLDGEYTINPDGTVDVEGNVTIPVLHGMEDEPLRYMPVQFGEVAGNFNIPKHNFTTLEYMPRKIGGNLGLELNYHLITNKFESDVKGKVYTNIIYDDIEQHTKWYIWYLENDCPDIKASINWLQRVDEKKYLQLAPALVEYSARYNMDWFSDDVNDIASTAMKSNHKLR